MSLYKTEFIIRKAFHAEAPSRHDVEYLLSLRDDKDIQALFTFADNVRQLFIGDGILLRGIVEFSSHCRNACLYCGINKHNRHLTRFRLSKEEILESVRHIIASGIRTVVLQAGEDPELDHEWLADVIRGVKAGGDIAVTLSVGEWKREHYALWKEAGADRYLLKMETTDRALYKSLHPGMLFDNRLRCLRALRELGYEVGTGNLIGLKGQTMKSIAEDILFFAKEKFDMLGIGPFIPHAATKLGNEAAGNVMLTLKAVAVARIVTKTANIPATTALGSLDRDYRIEGLKAGANVLMPNFTPVECKKLYELYTGKRCVNEPAGSVNPDIERLVGSINRTVSCEKNNNPFRGRIPVGGIVKC